MISKLQCNSKIDGMYFRFMYILSKRHIYFLDSFTYFTNTLIYVYTCTYFIRTYFSIHLRIIKEIYVLSICVCILVEMSVELLESVKEEEEEEEEEVVHSSVVLQR
jgi:hypothetical protein